MGLQGVVHRVPHQSRPENRIASSHCKLQWERPHRQARRKHQGGWSLHAFFYGKDKLKGWSSVLKHQTGKQLCHLFAAGLSASIAPLSLRRVLCLLTWTLPVSFFLLILSRVLCVTSLFKQFPCYIPDVVSFPCWPKELLGLSTDGLLVF